MVIMNNFTDFKLDFDKLSNGKTPQLSHEAYEYISKLIRSKAGIMLEENKKIMIQSRISRRLRALNLDNYDAYIKYLDYHPDEITHCVNALTTNKTDFFRENDHFDYLKRHFLKGTVQHHTSRYHERPIYIWSAACSMGHEVYTLAMIMQEFCQGNPQYDYRILGTDIDTEVLKVAEKGIYKNEILSQIPPAYLPGNFEKGSGKNKGLFRVSEKLREKVKFRQHNLIDTTALYPMKFDVIFLRNVLIYFPPDVIELVINKLSRQLNSKGYLFIGHSETLNGIKHDLHHVGSAVYQKKI